MDTIDVSEPKRFTNVVQDACSIASSLLGVALMAGLVTYVYAKADAARRSGDDKETYIEGYRTGYSHAVADGRMTSREAAIA